MDPAYTADNVAERDFLRTEGDPGAAGYTIKEALALTRSVVSVIICCSFHGTVEGKKNLYGTSEFSDAFKYILHASNQSCQMWI